ncbi:hypothetical protein NW768_001394 [Fusarium equiseti]|uniref:Uncharacterized protein n=1 Tax=Fusarium equiseti TaxID=61235 RepID=A0ABQ8RQ23_FUSEQ|nr:hypothetical protein NW768_001394 [Fusarium equiseti]
MSPDTASSLFPDRPIRPLPKRRLREKLLPEIAETIKYPPSTHEATPLFYYPTYTLKDEGSPPRICSTSPTQQGSRTETGRNYTPRQNSLGLLDGDDEEAILRSTLVTRSPPKILTRAAQRHSKPDQARSNAQPPLSATSSMDGYDLLENTNNKKKRKIPSAGDAMLNGTQSLNNEIGSLAISAGTGHSPTHEVHNDRPSPISKQEGGIISNAIANAEKLHPLGQENVSLLLQHSAATKSAPASTQFTFTCDSQVPGNNIQWPGHASKHNMPTQAGPGYLPPGSVIHHDGSSIAASRGSGSSRQDSKRRLERSLERAARRRRQAATEARRANPESASNGWICEFCEYESIFGEPPRALVRTYEIKDRKRRQEEADRKRLLEKAKAKSRKGRKGGKASSKDHATQLPPQDQGDHMDANHHHPTQSEDDEEEHPNLSERTGPDIRSQGPPS